MLRAGPCFGGCALSFIHSNWALPKSQRATEERHYDGPTNPLTGSIPKATPPDGQEIETSDHTDLVRAVMSPT